MRSVATGPREALVVTLYHGNIYDGNTINMTVELKVRNDGEQNTCNVYKSVKKDLNKEF